MRYAITRPIESWVIGVERVPLTGEPNTTSGKRMVVQNVQRSNGRCYQIHQCLVLIDPHQSPQQCVAQA